jgi:hypothetical protein
MKNHAAAAIAMRVHDWSYSSFNAGLAQCADHQVTLPATIRILAQVLHRAATANPEMRADRFNALCARLLDVHKPPAIRMARHGIDFDRLAGKSRGDVDRSLGAIGYSVAMFAEPFDQNPLNHARPQ